MPSFDHDLHTHTTYSDGSDWTEMAEAAAASGLAAVGFTDHCPIGPDSFGRAERYDFAETYPERRAELDAHRSEYDLDILDGAEINYHPDREPEIREFLDAAAFDYVIGSVHFAGEYNVTHPAADLSDAARQGLARTYVDWQVALIESELFDVVGHLDVLKRSESLRKVLTPKDYERFAAALSQSRTVPEINAGRLDRSYGRIHPDPAYLDVFADHGVAFVLGTDAHAPDQLERRLDLLEDALDGTPVELLSYRDVLDA